MSRTDVQKLSAALGRTREIGRYQENEERTPLVVYTSHSDTGYRVIIEQQDDPAESLVLTPNELRWLINVMFGGESDPTPAWRYWWANVVWRFRRAR